MVAAEARPVIVDMASVNGGNVIKLWMARKLENGGLIRIYLPVVYLLLFRGLFGRNQANFC